MNTINVDLSTGEALNLPIGRQGENNVTQVIFDFSGLKTEFGSGTLSLSVKRPKEYIPYAQTMTVSGNNATWLVNETDTGNFGCGEIQLTYTVSGKVAKTVIYKYTVLRSIGADGEYPIPGQTWQEEMEDEIEGIKEDLAELEGGGLSADLKAALDQLAQKVAYIDEDGQDYYDALHNALYPPASLSSISCVYTQSGTVYDTDTLDSLKSDLVVTAHYSNGTTQTVTSYTLSGTLVEGTSTITVSYGGKTTTFNVTVTHQQASYVTSGLISRWDGIDNTRSGHNASATAWEDLVGSHDLTLNNTSLATWGEDHLAFAGQSNQHIRDASSGFGDTAVTVEFVIAPENVSADIFFAWYGNSTYKRALLFFATGSISEYCVGSSHSAYPVSDFTTIRSIAVVYEPSTTQGDMYINNTKATKSATAGQWNNTASYDCVNVGNQNGTSGTYPFKGKVYAIRVYNRQLTEAELSQNHAADVERFGIGGA